ncbi:hypothetical protein V1517DRAFT_374362 [Lipomyces orientalis]|uniref:Uncharacterized protein n=1 Tax=Lipomyces orientalis TaxID=1233043 RepID=A0ACC3TLT7_9ASCO
MASRRRLYMGLGLVLLVVLLLGYMRTGRALFAASATVGNDNNNTTEDSLESDSQIQVIVGPYLSYRIQYKYYFTTKSIIRETMKVVYAYGGIIVEEKLVNNRLHFDIKMPCDIDFDKWSKAMRASMRYDFAFGLTELQRRIKVTYRYVADLKNCTVDQ